MRNDQTIQYTIYIGLNDADTGVQKHDTEKYISILRRVCQNYHVAFSFQLTLLNSEEATVTEIAKDLCAFFHQESVMVTKSLCSVVFIRDSL